MATLGDTTGALGHGASGLARDLQAQLYLPSTRNPPAFSDCDGARCPSHTSLERRTYVRNRNTATAGRRAVRLLLEVSIL